MTKLVSVSEAVSRIPDNAVVTVSSSSALGCPDLVLKALGERFRSVMHCDRRCMISLDDVSICA